jgi:hypothetical protein
MKKWRYGWKIAFNLLAILTLTGCVTISMEGCSIGIDGEDDKEKLVQEIQQLSEEAEKERRIPLDEDIVLAEGQILKVRLHYGTDTLDSEAWYKVRLDNPRNQWYDYVEWTAYNGFGASEKNYDDYDFGAVNFNKQKTDKHYDPEDVGGQYIMTVSGSNGYHMEKILLWDSRYNNGQGEWTDGTSPIMAFEVP